MFSALVTEALVEAGGLGDRFAILIIVTWFAGRLASLANLARWVA
jgi:hypothetical protein